MYRLPAWVLFAHGRGRPVRFAPMNARNVSGCCTREHTRAPSQTGRRAVHATRGTHLVMVDVVHEKTIRAIGEAGADLAVMLAHVFAHCALDRAAVGGVEPVRARPV